MGVIYIPSALARYTDGERSVRLDGDSLEEIFQGLGDRYPEFAGVVFREDGELKPHIKVFLNDQSIDARREFERAVGREDEVAIISAIAGG